MCGHPNFKLRAGSDLPFPLTLRLNTDGDRSVRNGAVQSVIEVVAMICLPWQVAKCFLDDIAGLQEEYKVNHLARKKRLGEVKYWFEPWIESCGSRIGGTYL